jgi:hypothetical protein
MLNDPNPNPPPLPEPPQKLLSTHSNPYNRTLWIDLFILEDHKFYTRKDLKKFFKTRKYDPSIPPELRAFAEELNDFEIASLIRRMTLKENREDIKLFKKLLRGLTSDTEVNISSSDSSNDDDQVPRRAYTGSADSGIPRNVEWNENDEEDDLDPQHENGNESDGSQDEKSDREREHRFQNDDDENS